MPSVSPERISFNPQTLHQTVSFDSVKMVHLTTLPLEILHAICANLCRHCTSEPVEPVEPGERVEQYELCFKGAEAFAMDKTKIKTAALSAMMLTCKTLRDIAQPYLYHYPYARAPAVSKLLLRSLVERPDLAHYINQLSMFDMQCQTLEGHLQILLRVPEYRDRSKEEITQSHTRKCHCYHNPLIRGKRVKFVKIKYDFVTAFTSLILPFGTGLQILHLELDEDRKFPFCKPGSFPRLKELVVKTWRGSEPADITVIASIFIAAPALERLGGLRICLAEWEGPRPPIHEGVKEIWLERCEVSPEGVIALLGLFPRLEALTYESDRDRSTLSLSRISDALLVCQDLRFLSLDFTNYYTGGEVHPRDQPGGGLAELKKLQKLRIKGLSLFSEEEWPRTGLPIKISDLLPASITELEVTHPGRIIFDDMLELSGVASQRFPLLKHVSIDGIEQEWEVYDWRRQACMGLERINKLRQAFGQSGIELSTGDFGKFVGFC